MPSERKLKYMELKQLSEKSRKGTLAHVSGSLFPWKDQAENGAHTSINSKGIPRVW